MKWRRNKKCQMKLKVKVGMSQPAKCVFAVKKLKMTCSYLLAIVKVFAASFIFNVWSNGSIVKSKNNLWGWLPVITLIDSSVKYAKCRFLRRLKNRKNDWKWLIYKGPINLTLWSRVSILLVACWWTLICVKNKDACTWYRQNRKSLLRSVEVMHAKSEFPIFQFQGHMHKSLWMTTDSC